VNWRLLISPVVVGVIWAALGAWTLINGESAVFPLAFSAFWLLVAFWVRLRGRQGA
jgi:uncharacterized membrane protein YfcA